MATDRIRLVASDMDATLLDEHSCLPQGFAGMVHALAQKDIRFAAGQRHGPCIRWKKCLPGCWIQSSSSETTGVPSAGRAKTCLFLRCLPQAGGSWQS